MKSIYVSIILHVVLNLAVVSSEEETIPENDNTFQETLPQLLEGLFCSTFVKLVNESKLDNTLFGAGLYTIFAPHDAAFEAIPKDVLDNLKKDKDKFQSFVLSHTLSGRFKSEDLKEGQSIPTINQNMKVRISNHNQEMFYGGAKVELADQEAQASIVHVLDKVIIKLPGQNMVQFAASNTEFSILAHAIVLSGLKNKFSGGQFTLFLPTNRAFEKLPEKTLKNLFNDKKAIRELLNNHLIPGTVYSRWLSNGTVTSLEGHSLNFVIKPDIMTVNDAEITGTDFSVINGIVHLVDTVLMPPV